MELNPADRAQVGQVPAGGAHNVSALTGGHGGSSDNGQANWALEDLRELINELFFSTRVSYSCL